MIFAPSRALLAAAVRIASTACGVRAHRSYTHVAQQISESRAAAQHTKNEPDWTGLRCALLRCAAVCSALLRCAVQCSAALCSAVQCRAALYSCALLCCAHTSTYLLDGTRSTFALMRLEELLYIISVLGGNQAP